MTERDAMIARLPELMRSLYETGSYFASIPTGPEPGFEESYWHEVVDPDGRHRDRLAERELVVADLGAELEYVASLVPGTILDAGCGLGWFLSALDPAWQRYGLELSAYAAEHARAYGEVREARLEECSFADGFFDVVFCHHVIEHIPEPVRAVEQLRRVLKPGGKLLLGTPDFDSGAARRYGARVPPPARPDARVALLQRLDAPLPAAITGSTSIASTTRSSTRGTSPTRCCCDCWTRRLPRPRSTATS